MWISDRSTPGNGPRRPPRLLLALSVLALAAPGWWGKKKPDEAPEQPAEQAQAPEPAPAAEPASAPAARTPLVPERQALFDLGLPLDPGPLPQGLANLSAQGCNACHYGAHEGWQGSAHATAWASPVLQDAVQTAGTPACAYCHLPLQDQHVERVVFAGGDPNQPESRPNDHWDPILQSEGVTCAACHVRDGTVFGPRGGVEAPHPVGYSPQFTQSSFCAGCHQLTWPGADKPLYDTYGEWSTSPQAKAGIQCQDCHMGPGAGAALVGPNHGFGTDPARAVSVLIEPSATALVRGGEPVEIVLRVQNTGAGHAFPTGSPFRAVHLQARLVGPPVQEGAQPTERALFETVLGRTLSDAPPWTTTEDTRLAAGGERTWSWRPALDTEDPAGPWMMEISLWEAVRGQRARDPLFVRAIPLPVD